MNQIKTTVDMWMHVSSLKFLDAHIHNSAFKRMYVACSLMAHQLEDDLASYNC
jgi:hypothetical protein